MKSEPQLTLRVGEAKRRDVGRGIARIDPAHLKKLGLDVGGVITLKGKQETIAKVMPTYPEDRGNEVVQIDGITRENVKVGLDENVVLQKADVHDAATLVLAPYTSKSLGRGELDSTYLATLLEGLAVVKGDRLRVNLFGTQHQDFSVVDTDPAGAVVITAGTRLKLKGEGKQREGEDGVTYEDIGGLSRELQRIREIIELPLKYPEVFERLGIGAPKGVLLHGPPGCGKTLIARAVASETAAYFTHISGPEIMGKFYGESEGRLRAVFEEAAEHTPSIVFIDEIDAIAPKREDMGAEHQVERRVVAQLLALMDGLKSRGGIIVIGATNIPNALDPALRRPGRFDREIALSIPDKHGRHEILQIHTRGMPLQGDVDVAALAEITHGFVGADLEALSREAAMVALRRILPEIHFEKEYIPYETLRELEVTTDDFREALKEVEPSALREVCIEIPDVSWDAIGGLEELKRSLREVIEWPICYPDLFGQANIKPPKGILLHGPPGCGKTLLAKAVASGTGTNFISVKGPQLLSKYIGDSEKGIRDIFRKAKQASPCIVFLDELDSLLPRRGVHSDSGVSDRVVGQFLAELDGIEELKGIVVLGATNRLDIIDPALLRPGRFDLLLEVPPPDKQSRLAILCVHTKGKPLAEDVDLENLATATEGLTGADIALLCQKAAMLAVRELLTRAKQIKKAGAGVVKITQRHFETILQQMFAAPLSQSASTS